MVKSFYYLSFFFVVIFSGSCSREKSNDNKPLKQDYVITQDQVYSLSNQVLDVYKPVLSLSSPIVIIVHGGGWREGSKSDLAAYAANFAESGIVSVAINYRLAPEHTFPSAFDDVSEAINWVKLNEIDLGADADKVFLMGYSAGGNLSLLAGLHPDNDVLGVISVAGPTDLENLINSQALVDANSYMGGTALSFGSPINLVSSNDPNVLMLHGSDDVLVYPIQSYNLSSLLTSAGVINQVIEYTGVGHEILYAEEAGALAAADMIDFIKSLSGL